MIEDDNNDSAKLTLSGDGASRTDENPQPDPSGQAMERMVERDRIQIGARMLPADGKLTKAQIEQVRQKLQEIVAGPGAEISMAQVAEQIGYASSTLSQWLNDRYRGKAAEVAFKVNLWIERHARRESGKKRRGYIKTWACDTMVCFIRLAHQRERMAAVVAPSGAGKDMVIDVLCDELNGYVVQCHKAMTVRGLLMELAERLAVTKRRGSSAEMVRQIINAIRDKSCTIFLNEAQQLSGDCASVIRTIHDQTRVPIIMLGSAGIFDFIDDRASGGGQFNRRTDRLNLLSEMRRALNPDRPKQLGRPLYSREEIRQFLAMKKLRLADDAALDMLQRIACLPDHGTFGLVGQLLDAAAILYGASDPITITTITELLYMHLSDIAGTVLGEVESVKQDEVAMAATA